MRRAATRTRSGTPLRTRPKPGCSVALHAGAGVILGIASAGADRGAVTKGAHAFRRRRSPFVAARDAQGSRPLRPRPGKRPKSLRPGTAKVQGLCGQGTRRRPVPAAGSGRAQAPAAGDGGKDPRSLRPGRARVRTPAAGVGPSRASRGGPGRLWPPRDARDVRVSPGCARGPSHLCRELVTRPRVLRRHDRGVEYALMS